MKYFIAAIYLLSGIVTGVCSTAYVRVNSGKKSERVHIFRRALGLVKRRGPGGLYRLARKVISAFSRTDWLLIVFYAMLLGSCGYRMMQWDTVTWDGRLCVGLAGTLLLSACVIDSLMRIIPNALALFAICAKVSVLTVQVVSDPRAASALPLLVKSFGGLLIAFLCMLIISLITKGGFGMGDVKLISSVSFLGGLALAFYSAFFGMAICMVYSCYLLARRKKSRKDTVAFGPFLYWGCVCAVMLGTF